jgi:hypothetical protein
MKIVSLSMLIVAACLASATATAQTYRPSSSIPESTPASPWNSSPSYRSGSDSGWSRNPAQADPDRAYRQQQRRWNEVSPYSNDSSGTRSADDRYGGDRKLPTWRPRRGAGSCTNPLVC